MTGTHSESSSDNFFILFSPSPDQSSHSPCIHLPPHTIISPPPLSTASLLTHSSVPLVCVLRPFYTVAVVSMCMVGVCACVSLCMCYASPTPEGMFGSTVLYGLPCFKTGLSHILVTIFLSETPLTQFFITTKLSSLLSLCVNINTLRLFTGSVIAKKMNAHAQQLRLIPASVDVWERDLTGVGVACPRGVKKIWLQRKKK